MLFDNFIVFLTVISVMTHTSFGSFFILIELTNLCIAHSIKMFYIIHLLFSCGLLNYELTKPQNIS